MQVLLNLRPDCFAFLFLLKRNQEGKSYICGMCYKLELSFP